ncbi:MAG: hypothetical protein BWY51_00124 [Parcubacteria group bacterium ADurb.Bin316]|nr:MAG: hypothetical protein BWY51_00124 [Parcubacteria group bacterium ADurb.Bin316]HOZ55730.1 hypothetical protein [bacterium]
MKYFFILGSNPALSAAEICALFPRTEIILVGKETAILETEQKIEPDELITRMGGTIKIGEVLFSEKKLNFDAIQKKLQPNLIQKESGKYNFGISYYGEKNVNPHGLAMNIKNYWREKNVNSRWVTSKEKVLSSVVVEQNKLISKGIEIIIIENENQFLIGKTLAVQHFKELSFRDFGRPSRDDRSGMIPPKLAQIMINLSKSAIDNPQSAIIYDPFCGSGTILTEAMLMSYANLIGSDSSPKAVSDTENNLKWIAKNYNIADIKSRIFQSGASSIAQKIKAHSVDAIITEPYLGPQRGNVDPQKIKVELEKLYSEAIQQFSKILKTTGVIIMIWPIFKNEKQDIKLSPNIKGFKIVSPISAQIKRQLALTSRDTIIYGRPGQKVWREIVMLKK